MTSEMRVVEKLEEYFESRRDICFAFLFGSHTQGKVFQESDVDIAIYLKEGYSFESIKRIWGELEEILRKEVDLVILNTTTPLIGYTAIRGRAIRINDYSAYLDYMLRTSQEAEDFREFFIDIWRLKERFRTKENRK